MRNPSGFGSVVRMPGKRRRPYAVRISSLVEYISVDAAENPPENILDGLIDCEFKYNERKHIWYAKRTARVDSFTQKHARDFHASSFIKQDYKYLAYFEKSAQAKTFLAEYNNGTATGEYKKYVTSPTFGEMYEKWVEYKKGLKNQISDAGWKNYRLAFKHLTPLHSRRVASIRTIDIQEVVNTYSDKSASTVGSIRAVLKGVFRYAKMNKYIQDDPVEFVIFEFTETEESIHKPYTEEEIQLLWDNLYKVPNVDIILIYLYTGMRPSELLEMRTEDVHIEDRYMVGGMKTEAGRRRTVPIHDKILPLVQKRYNPENQYLILNTHKNPYQYRPYWDDCHNPLMRKLGLDHRPHDTRHTFISMADRAGVDDTVLKMIVGHSLKGDVTKAVYTHKTLEDLLTEINKI